MAQPSRRPTSRAKRKYKYTAKTADKHELYQLSVQDPEIEIAFISRVYKKTFGKLPLRLREDFCGTALFAAEWVRGNDDRTAVGIDLDQPTLDWGIEHNLSSLGDARERVTLLNQDVRAPLSRKVDVAVGLNFSFWVFRTRTDLREYFKSVHRSLDKQGLFVLDAYGGPLSMEAMDENTIEKTQIKGGFTYVWDQAAFNPIDHSVVNHIHFEFKDGSAMNRAFTYEWRFWSLPEIREVLAEAGFSDSQVYWEDEDADGEGTGVYRARKNAENGGAWICYIIARV
jgi:SAM-dependent methyltransferase